MPSGTLFVVATPIGNLEDITLRALRTLREVDLIAAEDTRRTAKLLSHYDIHRPVTSLHEHNEWREADRLVRELQTGRNVALVSDAGTPGIADPGAILVDRCRKAGVTVSPVPGPSAIMAAISVSGINASQFVFAGFPPRAGKEREAWFERLAQDPRAFVFFEAPHRIQRSLDDGREYWSDRIIIVNKELTKLHESFTVWPNMPPLAERGELVVVVGPIIPAKTSSSNAIALTTSAVALFDCMTVRCELSVDEATVAEARAYGISSASLAKALKKRRYADKQQKDRLS